MSMKQELKELKRLRRMQTRTLHVTYLRTKRDIRHTLSPNRLIRRHMGASLGIAAVAGLLLAPRLGGHKKKGQGFGKKILHWIQPLLKKILPAKYMASLGMDENSQAPETEPADHPEETAEESDREMNFEQRGKRAGGLVSKLIVEVLMLLLSRLDLGRIVRDFIHGFKNRGQPETDSNGHGPRVSVADAGTLQEDPFNDLE